MNIKINTMYDKPKVTIDLDEYQELKEKKSFEDILMHAVKEARDHQDLQKHLEQHTIHAEHQGMKFTVIPVLQVNGKTVAASFTRYPFS